MAKQLKLKIKNIQLAKATGLEQEKKSRAEKAKEKPPTPSTTPPEEQPQRRKAKTRSSFAAAEKVEEVPVESENEPILEEESESSTESLPQASIPSPIEEVVVQEEEKETIEEEVALAPPPPPPPPAKPSPSPREAPPPSSQKLGPTGRHVKDLYIPRREAERKESEKKAPEKKPEKAKPVEKAAPTPEIPSDEDKTPKKKVRDFKDVKPPRKEMRPFDVRDRQGLTEGEEERWRKKRPLKGVKKSDDVIIRPTKLSIRIPISIKDLASEMKLKASELIQKLFLQGLIFTVNDILDDETLIVLLGKEFGCEVTIDTREEERIQVTKMTVQEEIKASDPEKLETRPPVAVFMGHVDHGKTSLIDAIRKSNIALSEAGAITQHIGAFQCSTSAGPITILDTPGHAAFSAMRARGAEVTDIVVLVVSGDEGIREQTLEAIQHAKAANVTIVVAINKSDKPNFNAENVYRQLADIDLLPESWGGQTITVNTSATTGNGISQLLEMLALQAEVLELKANPHMRARGIVLESEMHKGLGPVATILVQNGTLHPDDAIVLDGHWGRIKSMRDEYGQPLREAKPATPVEITGLSGVPEAGDSFIVVKNEREARDISETRSLEAKAKAQQQKKVISLENLLQEDAQKGKKLLKVILRSDVQGSVEALKASLEKIESNKVDLEIILSGVGEITESDIQLASASHAIILGFHTQIESRASLLIKSLGITVKLHNIIYHAIDEVKELMKGLLDKIPEEKEMGQAEVRALFKASQLGVIAGCIVSEGLIARSHHIRVVREGKVIWKGSIASLKRAKEDVREVKKGVECGILLQNFNEVRVGDILQTYEVTYLTQEL